MVKLDMPSANKVIKKFGLDKQGHTQMFLDTTLITTSDPYAPFETGALKNDTYSTGGMIHVDKPYARVLWHGIIMVDPKSGIAGFPTSDGFKSRKGIKKIPATQSSNRRADLPDEFNFKGAPLRGSKWVQRAFDDNKKQILKAVKKYMERGT